MFYILFNSIQTGAVYKPTVITIVALPPQEIEQLGTKGFGGAGVLYYPTVANENMMLSTAVKRLRLTRRQRTL